MTKPYATIQDIPADNEDLGEIVDLLKEGNYEMALENLYTLIEQVRDTPKDFEVKHLALHLGKKARGEV